MGAWAHDTFDNDTACDWAFDLAKTEDLSLVTQALARVIDAGTDYLDADVACEGLAACEVVARLKGNWGARNSYTEPVDNWVTAHPTFVSPDLVQQAGAVIDRVLSAPSELLELWEEGKEPNEWHSAVDNLRKRLLG
ncbi:MAG TPA: DUF4259 domain-containing protein [Gemmataceae bacterium]|nr:DUF4259 domain-containing protein [Gemmataceae bacterium]